MAEFGGSAGQLLNELSLKRNELNLINFEILSAYKNRQVNKKIKFVKSSIIENKIPDCQFDCLIVRDVLHHLVGADIKSTKDNQRKALNELKRMVRPNGVIYIEELVDESLIISRILYALLKINSFLKISIPKIDLNPEVRVLFFTKKGLVLSTRKVFSNHVIKSSYYPTNDIYEKLGHLGSKSGHLVLEITKKTSQN